MTGTAPDWGRAMEAAALEILGDPPISLHKRVAIRKSRESSSRNERSER